MNREHADPSRHNPFKVIEQLIHRGYKIPVYPETRARVVEPCESFITSQDFKTVDLGELFSFVKQYVFKLQDENKELRKDLYTVGSNGSVRYFGDDYYSNSEGVDESNKIHAKWFEGPVNFKDGEYFACPHFKRVTPDMSYCECRHNYKGVCYESFCPRNKEKE